MAFRKCTIEKGMCKRTSQNEREMTEVTCLPACHLAALACLQLLDYVHVKDYTSAKELLHFLKELEPPVVTIPPNGHSFHLL